MVVHTRMLATLFLIWMLPCLGQQASKELESHSTEKDLDPIALKVLKAATDPIRAAQSYSFRALVNREHPGTNGQIITLFHISEITVQRPDKLHMNFRGQGHDVELFVNSGQCFLYTPKENYYSPLPCAKTIDDGLNDLQQKDVFIPVRNFLASDPYQSLTNGVLTGYVVGPTMLMDQEVHHLAFTGRGVEWRLWVVGGERPTVRRLEVVDDTQPERPRIALDFLEWNLSATPDASLFTYSKPADAKQISMLRSGDAK